MSVVGLEARPASGGRRENARRARFPVRSGQVPGAQQELADDLTAGKPEGLLEEGDPLRLGPLSRCAFAPLRRCAHEVMGIEPSRERTVALPQGKQRPGVGDRGLHLEPIADDAGVSHQPRHVTRAEPRHNLGVETAVRRAERIPFLQNGEPGQPRLIDLQNQPLEQLGVPEKAYSGIMIGSVPGVAGGDIAVGSH